jgi:glutamate 5-kinase
MRIVIKVGTSTLTHATGNLNIRKVEQLCKVMCDLKNAGHQLVMVSSGAIGMGVGKLGLGARPGDMPTKQAAAAVGQCELMYTYDRLFSQYHHVVAQVLLTGGDIRDPHRCANVQNTLSRLLELNALPIVNENDAVSTDEIGVETTIGENDTLSAIVARLLKADLLILLSDIDGLYTADPRKDPNAQLISVVETLTPEIMALADGKGSALASGGMATKLEAARICTESGCDMVIANGAQPEQLYDILEGKPVGTRFLAKEGKQ